MNENDIDVMAWKLSNKEPSNNKKGELKKKAHQRQTRNGIQIIKQMAILYDSLYDIYMYNIHMHLQTKRKFRILYASRSPSMFFL